MSTETNPEQSGIERLRLVVEWRRDSHGWRDPNPRIFDGDDEFFLDPNEPGAIRHRGPNREWSQFNLAQLSVIHKLLIEAASYGGKC